MAIKHELSNDNSSSSGQAHYDYHYNRDGQRVNILASCYSVNASSGALQGFHYSTTGAGGTSLKPRESITLRIY